MTAIPPPDGVSVLVFDMARSGQPDGERIVPGFTDVAAARAYAEARIRASVEELRTADIPAAELRSLWYLYGEDCSVLDDTFRGSDMLDLYIEIPASPGECDWAVLTPRQKRYHVVATVSDIAGNIAWVGGFLRRFLRPDRETLLAIFEEDARAYFARNALPGAEPVTLDVVHLYELFDPPRPPRNDMRPLRNWRVEIDFVCHDVKFGSSNDGVFSWPEEPTGVALDAMTRLLMGDRLAVRGDSPENADYSEVLSRKVNETEESADFPLD